MILFEMTPRQRQVYIYYDPPMSYDGTVNDKWKTGFFRYRKCKRTRTICDRWIE
jgi:hypothetical protein